MVRARPRGAGGGHQPGSSTVPKVLADLPPELASHTYDHHDLSAFAGRKLLVLGAGSSAVDTAVLAGEAGADVTLLARAPAIEYHTMPDPDDMSWLKAITHPSSGIGPGWRSFMCSSAPRLFRRMPAPLRLQRHAPPSGAGARLVHARQADGRCHPSRPDHREACKAMADGVLLTARGEDGRVVQIVADHVDRRHRLSPRSAAPAVPGLGPARADRPESNIPRI